MNDDVDTTLESSALILGQLRRKPAGLRCPVPQNLRRPREPCPVQRISHGSSARHRQLPSRGVPDHSRGRPLSGFIGRRMTGNGNAVAQGCQYAAQLRQ